MPSLGFFSPLSFETKLRLRRGYAYIFQYDYCERVNASMEHSLPSIASRHQPFGSDFLGSNPLQSSPSSSGGNTHIASGNARQLVGDINTTFPGPVKKVKVEAHYQYIGE
jgi:hypothetical protein